MVATIEDLRAQRKLLPIACAEGRIVEELKKHDMLIIVGETGSGKTTQVPQFLLSAGFGRSGRMIGVTQPRRVAAISVASRVAAEMGVHVGGKVGYSIRFEDVTSPATAIKYMTDGMLLREILLDRSLSKYSVIIVDEAHERTVNTDVLFGLLKKLMMEQSSLPGSGERGEGNAAAAVNSAAAAAVAGKDKDKKMAARGEGGVLCEGDLGRKGDEEGEERNTQKNAKKNKKWKGEEEEEEEKGAGEKRNTQKEAKKQKKKLKREEEEKEEMKGGKGRGDEGGAIDEQQDVNGRRRDVTVGGGKRRVAPLKLIIMSATLEVGRFAEFFAGARILHVEGRQHPVETLYTAKPMEDYLDAAMVTAMQVHLREAPGDVLVFLTGQEEIESLERTLKEKARSMAELRNMVVVSMYAAMPSEQQMRVFDPVPAGHRKVVLATNIAETSLTIPGIRYVIDPGLVKARAYDPKVGVESLIIVPVSKAQARQRAGRAGREAPGKCYRLYVEEDFSQLEDSTVPEIRRCSLASVILQLKALGIDDVLGFDLMDKPPRAAIVWSLEQLYVLGALTNEGRLSHPIGQQMSQLPLEPLYSKAILTAANHRCIEEMITAVAMLSVDSIFYSPKEKQAQALAAKRRFVSKDGDHLTLINLFRSFVEEACRGCEGGQGQGQDLRSNQDENRDRDRGFEKQNSEEEEEEEEDGEGRKKSGTRKGGRRDRAHLPTSRVDVDVGGAGGGGGGGEMSAVPHKQQQQQRYGKRKRSKGAEEAIVTWCRQHFVHARALRKALDVRNQLRGYCEGMGLSLTSCGEDLTAFRRCLAASFFLNAACRHPDGTYRALGSGQTVSIHPSSVMFGGKPDCVVFDEMVRTNRLYIRNVSRIDSLWLVEFASQYYRRKPVTNQSNGRGLQGRQ
ncbi:hypothetical protein CBR_g18908 [Chara braunii]|uniref:RNA helicase n=1 Tax=Chara braunii TaxID=69332 RepID=A0A388KWW3_CHABU|nr:hypothetical protein CBR_g18908 [Chara braunii]|eukprot:GBG74498.1 hypothetical protein CBR_g18908 [Chara braunii]